MVARGMQHERAPAAADVETRSSSRSASFLQTISSFSCCASSSVPAPRANTAQLYVMEASRKSAKNSFETS